MDVYVLLYYQTKVGSQECEDPKTIRAFKSLPSANRVRNIEMAKKVIECDLYTPMWQKTSSKQLDGSQFDFVQYDNNRSDFHVFRIERITVQ